MEYSEEEIKRILNEYKLTKEEHEYLYNIIKSIWTSEKYPVKNPIAVIKAEIDSLLTGEIVTDYMLKSNNFIFERGEYG